MQQASQLPLLNGAMLLGAFTFIAVQLKEIPRMIYNKIKNRFVYSITFDDMSNPELYSMVNDFFIENYSHKFRSTAPKLLWTENNKRKLQYFQNNDVFYFKYNKKLILVSSIRDENKKMNLNIMFTQTYTLQAWRGKNIINSLVESLVDKENEKRSISRKYYNNRGWNYLNDNIKKLEHIISEDKIIIKEDIKDFISKENWYNERGIPYKRGYLLYGPPGNGKTSMLLGIANHFKKNVYFLDVNELSDDNQLISLFNDVNEGSILVFEDIDACYTNRESESKISFSSMLNCLDGAFSKHGLIVIMTTNHIEKLDPALIRDGRIDVKINMKNPSKKLINDYLNLFYKENIEIKEELGDFSMAYVQNVCIKNQGSIKDAISNLKV